MSGTRVCKNGCKRPSFCQFKTCCTYCAGPEGPHAKTCRAKSDSDPFEEFMQFCQGADDGWSCASDGLCKNGCSRLKFGRFKTCCTHCNGPQGPHSKTCLAESESDQQTALEEFMQFFSGDDDAWSCANGCSRPKFGKFKTCCAHCKGPEGPHAKTCHAKSDSAQPNALEEFLQLFVDDDEGWSCGASEGFFSFSCKNGCSRPKFDGFETCCTHCKGPQGPHSKTCLAESDSDQQAALEEFMQVFSADDDAWTCASDGSVSCKNGCNRPRFGRFETCCKHCTGPQGPHARSCVAESRHAMPGETSGKGKGKGKQGRGRRADDATTPGIDPKLLAYLQGKSLKELKVIAGENGIGQDTISNVDREDDPKGAVIQLIAATAGKEATTVGIVKAKTMYIVNFEGLPVSAAPDRTSLELGKLCKGSNVVVTDIAEKPYDGRERARIVCPAGWISTKMHDNSYHYAVPCKPEGGHVGTYIVVHDDGLPVTAEYGRKSPQVARIPKDTKIEILETAAEPDEGRDRARIAFPAGWISTKHESFSFLRSPMIVLGADAGQLPSRGDPRTFDWVRKGQTEHDRKQRRKAAHMTAAACADGCYVLDGESVQLKLVQYMCDNTRFVDRGDAHGPGAHSVKPKCIEHEADPMSCALDCKQRGLTTALVNAASAYQVGGGFVAGGRHALEESLCMQSTVFKSLHGASDRELRKLKGDGDVQSPYIPPEKVVLSPGVEVFRTGTANGYQFNKEVVSLDAVISMAMPNKNDKVKDAPVDAPADRTAYLDLLARKFESMLTAAASVKASALVIPAVGCGVYDNDPRHVGKALGEAILRYPGQLVEIHLVGSVPFCEATTDAMGMPSKKSKGPEP